VGFAFKAFGLIAGFSSSSSSSFIFGLDSFIVLSLKDAFKALLTTPYFVISGGAILTFS
jgi:hypothetical protein